jgi:pyrophosphate--fructose-6-phosphate 1-phosphotransferase
MELTAKELKKREFKGHFSPLSHFLGYEGRAAFPSNFDANYTYALGFSAAALIKEGFTGYMCVVKNLFKPTSAWEVGGIPIISLMHFEMRGGKSKPVIQKKLVDLKGKPFALFEKERKAWKEEDHYRFVGPMQFFGDPSLTDSIPLSLSEEFS